MSATESTSTALSIIAPTITDDDARREDALDALVETVDGLIQGTRNVGINLTTLVTTLSPSLLPYPPRNDANRHAQLRRRILSETQLRLKLSAGAPITPQDVIDCDNQTLKHRALVACGYERFVEEVGATTVDVDGEDSLIQLNPSGTNQPIQFVYVKDATSDKRYLLRVPPTMRRVREAIAWTFGMGEREYRPEVET